jgi:valyl-tRNA synthetase
VHLVIVDTNKNHTVVAEQVAQQFQAWIHHAEPFVVSRQILSLVTDDFAEPLANFG